MNALRPGDSVVVAFRDRFSRYFEDVERIQADLTRDDIGVVAILRRLASARGRWGLALPDVHAGPWNLPGGLDQ